MSQPPSPESYEAKGRRTYLLRTLLAPISALRWTRRLAALHRRVGAPAPLARALSKPLRAYLHRTFGARKRLSVLMESYDWLEARFDDAFLRRFYAGQTSSIVSLEARKNTSYGIHLTAAVNAALQREGEVAIFCTKLPHGEKLCRAAFSVASIEGRKALVIGGMQGPPAANKREVIDATRELHGLRPKDAVLLAIRAFAAEAGIAEIHAVSDANHVLRRLEDTAKFSSYDEYWQERGAKPGGPFGFVFEPLGRAEPVASKRDGLKVAIVVATKDFVRAAARVKNYSPRLASATAISSSVTGSSIVAGIPQES